MAQAPKIPNDQHTRNKIIALLNSIALLAGMGIPEVNAQEIEPFSDTLDMIAGDLDSIHGILEDRPKVRP